MSFDYSEDVKDLQQELRRLLRKDCSTTTVHAVLNGAVDEVDRLHRQLAGMGWLAAALPTQYGGQGLGYCALAAIAEELGRALVPTSFGSSIFLAAEALLKFGSETQRQAWLSGLGEGTRVGTFALAEKPGSIAEDQVQCSFANGFLNGTKLPVADGLTADFAIVAARTGDGVRLVLAVLNQPGVIRAPVQSMDPTRPLARISFAGCPARLLGEGGDWQAVETLLDRAAVLFAFEQLGAADAALEMAREYALSRYAFGRPIGSFQAIKHKLADVYIGNALARANAQHAASALMADAPDLALAAAVARVAACEALERAAREAMQTHGGVSATWAHDCHLFYRRARHLNTCIGPVQHWRSRAAEGLLRYGQHTDIKIDYNAETREFQAEVHAWMEKNASRYQWGAGSTDKERFELCLGWMRAKAEAGYAGIALPKQYGGRGGTPIEDVIFREEEAVFMNGSYDESFGGNLVGMAVPTILAHAQPGWAERLIPGTLSGDFLWCQLFSEPGAGSDMAGFTTRAVRDGHEWVINGQKIWTSGAAHAHWGLLLARTDPTLPKHRGLTFFLVDMTAPGIEVRPLKQISGRADFNEVFFTDLRLPDSYRMGEVNGGWVVALTTMMNERLTLLNDPSTSRDIVDQLLRISRRVCGPHGGLLCDDPVFREKLASYYVAVAGMRHIRGRIREDLGKGTNPGPEASIGKVTITKWLQEMSGYAMDVMGVHGQMIDVAADPDLALIQESYFLVIGYRIGGGTEEITKNIIAERLLGLPQELRPDKDIPFRDVPTGATR